MKAYIKQKGQAVTEGVIALSFVIIPLMMLLPVLSKVTFVQHQAEQASHYNAWERTVWRDKKPDRVPSSVSVAIKSEKDIAKEIPWRFYQKVSIALSSTQRNKWDWKANSSPYMKANIKDKRSHNIMLKPHNDENVRDNDPYDRFSRSHKGGGMPGSMSSAVEKAVKLVSIGGFKLERDQFYKTSVTTRIEALAVKPFDDLALSLTGNDALLASGWNAAGPGHIENRVKRLVLTTTMDNGVIKTVQNGIGFLPIAKEIRSSSLKLGFVAPNVLPKRQLCRYGSKGCGS